MAGLAGFQYVSPNVIKVMLYTMSYEYCLFKYEEYVCKIGQDLYIKIYS